MKFHPMAMHLHTCHQQGASMEAQIANAARLGMRYIRLTDHDTRLGVKSTPIPPFDFSRGALIYEDAPGQTCGWEMEGHIAPIFEEDALVLRSEAGQQGAITFTSSGKRHMLSLLAGPMLYLNVTRLTGAGRLVVDVRLSQRPPDHAPAHLLYVWGKRLPALPPHSIEIPFTESGRMCLPIAVDAEAYAPVTGGRDNAFVTVTVRVEDGAACRLSEFSITAEQRPADVLARQRALAEQIGGRYGVKPFVTYEISGAGQHKNVYTTAVPILDYAAHGHDITAAEAVTHVKAYDGIFAYNHPFENSEYKKLTVTDEDKPRFIAMEAARLIANRLWGATLMEVGFPANRGVFTQADYLALWDLLSAAGVFITGCGDSDSHYSDRGWNDKNNFVSYIGAPEERPFPIAEDVFTHAMKAGHVFAGDPVYLPATLSFTAGDAPMGSVLPIEDRDNASRRMRFTADSLPEGCTVRIIADGMPIKEITAAGVTILDFTLIPRRTVSFARVEIYAPNGRLIGLSNPIYLVRTAEYAGEIPAERLYTKVQEVEA